MTSYKVNIFKEDQIIDKKTNKKQLYTFKINGVLTINNGNVDGQEEMHKRVFKEIESISHKDKKYL